jgi:hypothetical protein
MAKKHPHLALAKFADAEKYAPNWERLHMKWGEAPAYTGKKDEAPAVSEGINIGPHCGGEG